MDIYSEQRLVSWIAHWCNRGCSLEEIISRAAARRPPFAVEDVRRLHPLACQSVRNAEIIGQALSVIRAGRRPDATQEEKAAADALRGKRVCDLGGCKWPE